MGYSVMKSTKDTMLGKDPGNVELPAPELTSVEKQALYDEALKAIHDELKEKESARLLEEYKKDVRRKLVPSEALEPILVDLAGHANKIVIDGTQYFHGVTYHFTRSQAETIREIIWRTWRHEHEIGGANGNAYRRPRNLTLGPENAHASLEHLMRV